MPKQAARPSYEKPAVYKKKDSNIWYSDISPDGTIRITIKNKTRSFSSKEVIALIKYLCTKNDRFAEVNIEGKITRYIKQNTINPPPKAFCYCALYSVLRSSGAYDSPYGGGANSVFDIPAYLGCTIPSNL